MLEMKGVTSVNNDHLRTFVAVAKKESFSEAAKALYVSQPTVTAQIKSLEEELNTKLFIRTKKSVDITAAGKVLFHYAEEILNLCTQAQNEIASLEDVLWGTLYVASSLTVGESVLPVIMHDFTKEHPSIQLKTEIINSSQIVDMVRHSEIEVGLIEVDIHNPRLAIEPFMDDELVLFTDKNMPLPEDGYVSMSDFKALPLIMREEGSGTRTVFESGLASRGHYLDDCNVVLEIGNTESIKTAVEAGLGVSILSKNTVRKEVESGLFKTFRLENLNFKRQFYVVYEKDKTLSAVSQRFIELVHTFDWGARLPKNT